MGVYSSDQINWLEQAILSVVNQTYKNFLFTIVIDGHIDSSMSDYLGDLSLEHDNILLIKSEHNRGLSSSMNFVIDWMLENNPKAKYFFRMDSDDISLPDRFEKQIAFFEKNLNVSVLGTSLVEINEKGKKVGKRKLPIADHEVKRILPRRCAINHPTVVIRTEVFMAGYRYRAELKNTQDYFLWAELSAAGYRFANLPEALLQFRRVNDFYKRRGLSKSINEFKARFYVMKKLKRYSLGNVLYALTVLLLRLMPAKIVKLAYKLDRYLLNKRVRHE
ncbi:glycosyltransferase [Aliiglaciecola sp.]|nr:glycosyltransferase [Aliiglaciecola sp.]